LAPAQTVAAPLERFAKEWIAMAEFVLSQIRCWRPAAQVWPAKDSEQTQMKLK
jgi:hypothetical protein